MRYSSLRNTFLLLLFVVMSTVVRAADKPNILVIWGDDIGILISANTVMA